MTLPSQPFVRSLLALAVGIASAASSLAQSAPPLQLAQAAQPVPKPASRDPNGPTTRNASIPARGLFKGDQLSDSTKAKLTELMMEAIGSRIELALLVPTGPWQIDGAGQGDTNLNTARLQSLRRFLTDRGVDPNKVVVESRIDEKIKTPRLDVQLVTTPAND
jgi:OmpA-OmpF porin, OOP family